MTRSLGKRTSVLTDPNQRRELGWAVAVSVAGSAVFWALGELFGVLDEVSLSPKVFLWLATGAAVILLIAVWISRRRERLKVGDTIRMTVDPELAEEIWSYLTPEEAETVERVQRNPLGVGWQAHKSCEEALAAAGRRFGRGQRPAP